MNYQNKNYEQQCTKYFWVFDNITPNQVLTCPGGFLYVIKPGDTYYSIARRFGTVVPALEAANPGVDPNRLTIGQSICVPAPNLIPLSMQFLLLIDDVGTPFRKVTNQYVAAN